MSYEMKNEVAIRVQNLSKCYHIYEKPRDRLKQMIYPRFQRMVGRSQSKYHREFWALRDVSFEVKKGEIVGIMGRNGSGKSTLLQIICNTISQTDGTIQTNGRIAALLELGSGFNPDFTGIENVYMNSQILGLSKAEVDEKLPAIESFAGIGEFIHQPVKTYSSGMFARLAFSVAAHVDPDILVVDEALSVGDSWFQHKSMARMRQLMSSGCTVLFVSHSIDAVRGLCNRAVWLDSGSVKMIDSVTSVTNAYMNEVFIEHNRLTLESQRRVEQSETRDKEGGPIDENSYPQGEYASGADNTAMQDGQETIVQAALSANGGTVLRVQSVSVIGQSGKATDRLQQGEQFRIEIVVEFLKEVKNLSVGFVIKDQFGQELTGESLFNSRRRSQDFLPGTARFTFSSTMMFRGGESYSIALRINQVTRWDRTDNIVIYTDDVAAVFDVATDLDQPMWFKFKQPFTLEIT